MKRNLLSLFATLFSVLILSSCGKKGGEGAVSEIRKERLDHNKKLYSKALAMHDPYTQLYALNEILMDDSTSNKALYDSLAYLYSGLNLVTPASKLADKVLATNPEDIKMQEVKVAQSVSAGNSVDLMQRLRKLYGQTNKLKYLYSMIYINLQQNNMKDAEDGIAEIEKKSEKTDEKIDVTDPQTNMPQAVPAKAAYYYLKGLVAYAKKDVPGIMKEMKQALEVFPEFVMANNFMRELTNSQKQSGAKRK